MIETTEQKIVDAAITSRRSIRAFLPRPVAREDIEAILDVAARAPSGTNTQPWKVYVLGGKIKDKLSQEILTVYVDPARSSQHAEEYHYYPREWVSPSSAAERWAGICMLYWVLLVKIKRECKRSMAAITNFSMRRSA